MSKVSNQQTRLLSWTVVGIARQDRLVAEAKSRLDKLRGEVNSDRFDGEVSLSEGKRQDRDAIVVQIDQAQKVYDDAVTLRGRLREVPGIPPSHAFAGTVVRYRHLDEDMILKRGSAKETFLLGGPGESDTDSKLRTYSVSSPLGAAIRGKSVGDTATIVTPGDGEYEIEIVQLRRLDQADFVNAAVLVTPAARPAQRTEALQL